MKKKIVIFIILIFIILSVMECRNAGSWLVKDDKPEHADAMVMLFGSTRDRVLHVADLYHQNITGKIILPINSDEYYHSSEVKKTQNFIDTLKVSYRLGKLGVPLDSIVKVRGDAISTMMEAVIVREYLRNNTNLDTLIIISSKYHTRRASMIFKAAVKSLDNPVTILCSPSPYTKFNKEKWWRSKGDIKKVVLEYLKILNFILFERHELKD